ncbi:MAG: hypothetical protein FJZ97_10165 [Chloroflexi bacterium]|nr:hypothetical protein [Chloroflexota bacterium]
MLTVLLIGNLVFRRRDPGRHPGFAGAFQFVVPGLGYAYLHRWDRFLVACLLLIGGRFLLDRILAAEDRYLLLFVAVGIAARVFDCMLTARRMAPREAGGDSPAKRK